MKYENLCTAAILKFGASTVFPMVLCSKKLFLFDQNTLKGNIVKYYYVNLPNKYYHVNISWKNCYIFYWAVLLINKYFISLLMRHQHNTFGENHQDFFMNRKFNIQHLYSKPYLCLDCSFWSIYHMTAWLKYYSKSVITVF